MMSTIVGDSESICSLVQWHQDKPKAIASHCPTRFGTLVKASSCGMCLLARMPSGQMCAVKSESLHPLAAPMARSFTRLLSGTTPHSGGMLLP
jgi:hypothetical protein